MNVKSLWKPFSLYAGLLGLLTVGTIYLVTHSGLFILVLAGMGLLLVVLGGGTASPMSPSGAEHAEQIGGGLMIEDTGLWPHSYVTTSLRGILLFYGVGLFLWSLIVLATLGTTLR